MRVPYPYSLRNLRTELVYFGDPCWAQNCLGYPRF
jgi:hypothetical protein